MTHSSSACRESIQANQLSRLHKLLHAMTGNRFYASRLAQLGLDGDVSSLGGFFDRMPLTTKNQLASDQQENPPFGTNLTRPLKEYVRFHQTSGTTGIPLRWIDTRESWQAVVGGWQTVLEKAGVTRDDRLLAAFSFGPFLGFWSAFDAAAEIGCLCLPGGGQTSLNRLHMMIDNQATVLCCTPTYAMHLAEAAAQHDIDLRRSAIRLIVVAGEPGGSLSEVRKKISDSWHGARVFDHHGMTETGPVTYECPGLPGALMVMEDSFLAEILDPQTGNAVAQGQTGELVLTTLARVDAPLLRYRTGDLVRTVYLDDEGQPGSQLALEGGILGRIDDMVTIRGVNIYPAAIDRVLHARPEVIEYRVEIDSTGPLQEMRITVEPETSDGDSKTLANSVEEDLRTALLLRIPVHVVAPGTLPRFELKARRWLRR
jgi:phenylacetate-CoA ligase